MSTFGTLFRVTTYGESHCSSVGCIVDGCPPGLQLEESDIQPQLSRRRPGQSALTTPNTAAQRQEADAVAIQSGTEYGVTLGSPIGLRVQNKDHRPGDYSETDLYPRPSHADWTYLLKYGVKSSSGGGRSSARETIGRVAAGAIAEKYLREAYGVEIVAFVSSVGKVHLPFLAPPTSSTSVPATSNGHDLIGGTEADDDAEEQLSDEYMSLLTTLTRDEVDARTVRCPHAATAERMEARILRAKAANDSIGGTVTCVVRNMPTGLGEPCFDKLEAQLAHAMMSIPATKAFEIGSGFAGTEVSGSRHNDAFVRREDGGLRTKTNRSGGVQGGISNGEHVYFRVAFKSPATISREQSTAAYDGADGVLATRGRHDPCVVPRALPIVEAMAALVIMDSVLIQAARSAASARLPPLKSLGVPKALRKEAIEEVEKSLPVEKA